MIYFINIFLVLFLTTNLIFLITIFLLQNKEYRKKILKKKTH